MKWIKASDRQPGDWDKVMARHVDTKWKVYRAFNKGGVPVFNVISPDNIIGYFESNAIEWLDETPIDLDAIISEVDDMHPYKESGNRESFSKYNEGWSDACDVLGNKIREALGIPVHTIDVDGYIDRLIERAGDTWKGVDAQKFMDMVRGREDE